jgi:class 3 adenylate cyclase/tetratricopeptide (TPR) repeat protein
MADVFLSYASEDVERATTVVKTLQDAGYSVWWDRHLLSGERFTESIQRELTQAAAVVVVWTPASVQSEWVYSEARRGNQRKVMLQVRSADVTIDDIPAPFDAFHCPLVDDADALLRSVATLTGSAAGPSRQAAPGPERKVVTALVAQLESSAEVDPEDYETVVAPYLARLRSTVEGYGGSLDTTAGMSVTAVFGAPHSHEDDPQRAALCALDMLEATAALNAEGGHRFSLRVGISTGAALVSAGAQVTGDTVASAHRLQATAPADTVLASGETYSASRASIEYEPHESCWRVVRSRGSTGEDLADTSLPMLGREDELAQLQRSFNRAVRESSVQLVTIIAEPGMGKSRLVQAFSDWIDAREELVTWRQGQCPPYGDSVAYAALGEIVKAHTGILDSDDSATATRKLTETVTALVADTDLAEQVSWLTARLAPLVGLQGGEASQEELFTAWRRFLEALAATGPLIIVIEDLHWADPALLAFMTHVLEWTVGMPLLIVATARPELYDKAPHWAAAHHNATTLTLAPLDEAGTAQLVTFLLGRELPAGLMSAVVSKAAGNPLYAREYATMLSEQANPGLEEGQVKALVDTLPGSVQAVIASRLDTLTFASKRLLQCAAVIGHTFWSGAVAALTGRDRDSMEKSLHDLVRRDYLRLSRASRIAGQAEYTFSHALIADVAYGQLPRTDRARYHQATADWYVALINDPNASAEAAVVAHHYTQALAFALDSQGSTEQVARLSASAAEWHAHAGEHARVTDLATALSHARTAVELTADSDAGRARRLILLGEMLVVTGQYALAEETFASARRAADLSADAHTSAYAEALRSTQLQLSGRTDEAESAFRASIAVLEAHPPGLELIEAYLRRAQMQNLTGRARDAMATVHLALKAISQVEDVPPSMVTRALMSRGEGRIWSGETAGVEDLLEGLELAQRHNQTGVMTYLFDSLATWHYFAQSAESAIDYGESAVRAASLAGRLASEISTSASLAETLVVTGRLDEAIETCRAASATAERLDVADRFGSLASYWAWAHLVRGDLDQAHDLLSTAAPYLDGSSIDVVLDWLVVAAEWGIAAGARDPRWVREGDLVQLCESGEVQEQVSQYLSRVGRILAADDRLDLLARLIGDTPAGMVFYDNNVLSARATLAHANGDDVEALSLHQQAADAWAAYGYPLEQAHSLLGAAEGLTAQEQPARHLVEQARDVLKGIGARQLLAQTEQLLAD